MTIARLDVSPLDELAATINREHELALRAAVDALSHAFLAGRALLDVRELIGDPSDWLRWIDVTLGMPRATAYRYARLAYFQPELANMGATSITQAARMVADASLHLDASRGATAPVRQKALELVRGGVSQREVADLFGVSQTTVSAWLDPQAAKRRSDKYRGGLVAARKARERDERNRTAKRVGDAIGKAYSFTVGTLAPTLDRAIARETDPAAKKALTSALHSLYNVEDKIVAALATSKPVST